MCVETLREGRCVCIILTYVSGIALLSLPGAQEEWWYIPVDVLELSWSLKSLWVGTGITLETSETFFIEYQQEYSNHLIVRTLRKCN